MTSSFQRPPTAAFDVAGARVTLLDGPGILREAESRAVSIVQRADVPLAVAKFEVVIDTVTAVASEYRFTAAWSYAPRRTFSPSARTALTAAGMAAVGFTTGLVGVGVVGAAVAGRRWYKQRKTAASQVVAPPIEGVAELSICDGELRVVRTVAKDGLSVGLHTAIPKPLGTQTGNRYLGAFLAVTVEQLARQAGIQAGAEFLFSNHPGGRWADVGDGSDVRFRDIGGLDATVDQLRFVANAVRNPADVRAWGSRPPQGVLLYGPPGTGKTMLVTALANEIGAELVTIDSSSILNMYVGNSEERIKKIFQDARARTQSTVLFFDEFDSIIQMPPGGIGGGDAVSHSVAGIFRTEMNTLALDNPNILVAAATNYLDERVDPTLIRSGRFDVKIEVGLPGRTARREIFSKKMAYIVMNHEIDTNRIFADDVDIDILAAASQGLVGADIAEVLRRATFGKAVEATQRKAIGDSRPVEPISCGDLLVSIQQVCEEKR
jgi:transitional endoplasmic reticulum ATPase